MTIQARLLEIDKVHKETMKLPASFFAEQALLAKIKSAWPDIADEIARLTSDVERLQNDGVKTTLLWGEDKTKADALAEAVEDLTYWDIEMTCLFCGFAPCGDCHEKDCAMQNVLTVLTAYQKGK